MSLSSFGIINIKERRRRNSLKFVKCEKLEDLSHFLCPGRKMKVIIMIKIIMSHLLLLQLRYISLLLPLLYQSFGSLVGAPKKESGDWLNTLKKRINQHHEFIMMTTIDRYDGNEDGSSWKPAFSRPPQKKLFFVDHCLSGHESAIMFITSWNHLIRSNMHWPPFPLSPSSSARR